MVNRAYIAPSLLGRVRVRVIHKPEDDFFNNNTIYITFFQYIIIEYIFFPIYTVLTPIRL